VKRFGLFAPVLLMSFGAAHAGAPDPNPLVGAWELQQYVDVPEGGLPVYALGEQPTGLMVFTADGHVSISLMRNPPTNGPDNGCVPTWYCSYFGTYTYDPSGPSWTTYVVGGNIHDYLGKDERRTFKIEGDTLTITDTYSDDGKTYHGQRVLRRISR